MKLQEISKESLLGHYWDVIRSVSEKSSGMDLDQDYPDVSRLQDEAKLHRAKYCFTQNSFESDKTECQFEANLKSRWNKQGKHKTSIIYPSRIPVQKPFKITPTFSLSELGTVLDLYPKKVDGISNPFLYVGSEYASFAWHTEDVALFSLNVLHYGADCVWFFTRPEFFKQFTEWAKFFLLDLMQISCINILGGGHKYILAGSEFLRKLGIPVEVVIQKAGEIIVTYPFTLHSGFKTGWNIQEAVNFGDEWWVEPAIFAPVCDCFCDNPVLKMDLKEIIAVCREDLLKMYVDRDFLGLMKIVSQNPFIKRLGILPSSIYESSEELKVNSEHVWEHVQNMQKPSDPVAEERTDPISQKSDEGTQTEGNNLSVHQVTQEDCEHSVKPSHDKELPGNGDHHTATQDSPGKERRGGRKLRRSVLECPHEQCKQKYEGGLGRLERLKKHISSKHGGDSALLQSLSERYPPRQMKSKKSILCHLCGQYKAGGTAHLKLHLYRKHPGVVFTAEED